VEAGIDCSGNIVGHRYGDIRVCASVNAAWKACCTPDSRMGNIGGFCDLVDYYGNRIRLKVEGGVEVGGETGPPGIPAIHRLAGHPEAFLQHILPFQPGRQVQGADDAGGGASDQLMDPIEVRKRLAHLGAGHGNRSSGMDWGALGAGLDEGIGVFSTRVHSNDSKS